MGADPIGKEEGHLVLGTPGFEATVETLVWRVSQHHERRQALQENDF